MNPKAATFKFDQNKVVVSMILYEMYLIIVFETSIAIYNATSGDFLEERGRLEKFKYKAAAINNNGNEIYLVTHNNSTGKNIV